MQPQTLTGHLNRLAGYRELLWLWTLREIRARHRQSVLGFGWVILQPFVQMVVISVIFGSFLRLPTGDVPYPVFAYVALLPWNFFSGSVTGAVSSVINGMELVTKTYFPREILPLSVIASRFADLVVASIVLVGLLIWYRIPASPAWLFVIVLLLIQTVLAIGVGLIGSAVSVFVRDVSIAMPLVMQIWLFATPVMYPLSIVPQRWLPLYMLNPMAGIIHSYRVVILEGRLPEWHFVAYPAAVAIVLCASGYIYFKQIEMHMADVI